MFKLYDKAFKVGFCFNILIFVILNIISCANAYYKDAQSGIHFSNYFGPSWGFPFEMTDYVFFSVNIFIIAGCGFVVGLLFRYIWSKMGKQGLR